MDFLTDQYPDISIKGGECNKRATAGFLIDSIQRASQKCPRQWKNFLAVGANKMNLIAFLLKEWTTNAAVYATKLCDCFSSLVAHHVLSCLAQMVQLSHVLPHPSWI